VPYKHINSDDRIIIATLLEESRSVSYIARRIGVNRSSIGREITRGSSRPKPKHINKIARPKIIDIDGRKFRGTGFTKTKHQAIDTYNKAVAAQTSKNKYYYSEGQEEGQEDSPP
jgi:IS30 family transposase